jgi:cell division protein FtsW
MNSKKRNSSKKNPDFLLILSISVLLIFGLLMVFSASSLGGGSLGDEGEIFYYFGQQFKWAILGIFVFFAGIYIPLTIVKRLTPLFTAFVLATLIAVLFIGVGAEQYGAARWMYLGPIRFQPSELAKLAVVFLLAGLFSSWKDRIKKFFPNFLITVLIIGGISVLVLMEPDLGTTFMIATTGFFMLFIAGANLFQWSFIGIAGLAGGIFSISQSSYQMRRWEIYKDPMLDPLDGGYQIIQGLYAIGSGGISGLGLGNSRQIYWVPQKHTDFIFAILAEETGLIGASLVVIMFLLLTSRGFIIAKKAPSLYMRYLAIGLTYLIAMQGFINIAVVTNLIPTTGITLPFISYGGTSLLITMAAAGLILNVSRYTEEI